jgi:hypothetical protein
MKKFRLRAELSAMENLFEACNAAARYILSRKKLRLSKEEWAELLDIVTLDGVDQFLRIKIGQHTYNRKYDFFSNAYSAVYSVSGGKHAIYKYLEEIKHRLNSTSTSLVVGVGDDATVEDLIADTGRHPLEHGGAAMYEKMSGRYYSESREAALQRIWSDEDAENAEGGIIVDRVAIEQHRKAVLDRLHSLRTPKSETVRKWRERQRVEDPEGYKRYLEQERKRSKARYDRQKAEKASKG